jgi:uncharacterized circularly permuted ATP-grasp superfamily protein
VANRIKQFPPAWVAQPVIDLSTMPTFCSGAIASRHVDLRPFTLLGPKEAYVVPGGLTRVAQVEGSLIVNSSQGGGSKDTWVIRGVVGEASVSDVIGARGAWSADAEAVGIEDGDGEGAALAGPWVQSVMADQ